jgi:hypothetical protein
MSEGRPPGIADVVLLREEARTVEVLRARVAGLWDVVSELTRLRRTYRTNYRVSISGLRWTDQRNGFALVPAVDPEIGSIHGQHREAWVELAHPDQA